ncbi:MAG: hypothetical protein V7K47_08360 [Nostoc sp.]
MGQTGSTELGASLKTFALLWLGVIILDFSLVRTPRSMGGVGGKASVEPEGRKAGVGRWGRNLSPHTPHTSHTPDTLVRN